MVLASFRILGTIAKALCRRKGKSCLAQAVERAGAVPIFEYCYGMILIF
jgi:hypothetical protein